MKANNKLFLAALFSSLFFSLSAQWTKLTLPATNGDAHLTYPGIKASIGKNALWMFTIHVGPQDTTRPSISQSVRTTDGGRTFKTSNILPNGADYFTSLQPVDERIAFMAVDNFATGAASIRRSLDSGATWQELPFHPSTWVNEVVFYDANNGVALSDPDSLGFNFVFSTDGGNTFTRIPQANLPRPNPQEALWSPVQKIGNTLFIGTIDFETGLIRILRSLDRGRNWTAGAWYEDPSPFAPNYIFTDSKNGLMTTNHILPNEAAYFTTDGGATWQPSGRLPDPVSGGPLGYVPNTQNIVGIFTDTVQRRLYSALTNDYGKTWNTRKDLAPYRLDSVYVSSGIAAFAWTNLEIVDNNTAWAKFSRKDFYRYSSTTPIVPEKPDLDLTLTADQEGLPLWNAVKFTLTIRNRGISKATGIRTNWLPPYKRTTNGAGAFAHQAAYASKGRYDDWNGAWTLPELQPNESATVTFHLFVVNNSANISQSAQIVGCNESDLDSAPNNMTATSTEDDEARFTSAAHPASFNEPIINTPSVSALKITPNPAREKAFITIREKSDTDWTVQVLNNTGQVVFTQKGQYSQFVEFNTESLPNGMYFVEFKNGVEKKVEKLMVQH